MELYEVSVDYVEYLRKFEPRKILSVAEGKDRRKFMGVIVQKNGYKYVVPLSSPKYLKDYKIKGFSGERLPSDFSFVAYMDRIELLKKTTAPVVYMYTEEKEGIDFFGKLQCNNMIPVPESELVKVDVDAETDIAYKTLMQKQIQFLRKNEDKILKKHAKEAWGWNCDEGRKEIVLNISGHHLDLCDLAVIAFDRYTGTVLDFGPIQFQYRGTNISIDSARGQGMQGFTYSVECPVGYDGMIFKFFNVWSYSLPDNFENGKAYSIEDYIDFSIAEAVFFSPTNN